jgi:hypothetical protein
VEQGEDTHHQSIELKHRFSYILKVFVIIMIANTTEDNGIIAHPKRPAESKGSIYIHLSRIKHLKVPDCFDFIRNRLISRRRSGGMVDAADSKLVNVLANRT